MTLSAIMVRALVVAEEPFATTTAGRVLLPAIASLLVAAVVGGIAWARWMTRNVTLAATAAKETTSAVERMAEAVERLTATTNQLAINGAVTSDQISRHLQQHPGH